MDKKYGVYICKGCSIGESIDIEKLTKDSAKATKIDAGLIKSHPVLCSPEGREFIKNDIKEGTNTLILGACSPRVKYEEFDFPGTITERVNLRELVAWSQPANVEDTQMLANDYLKMGIIRTQKGDLPEPNILQDLSKAILVIGGGISGLTAALEAANAGYQVVLVEKEAELGGWAAKLYKEVPREYPYEKLDEPIVFSKIKEVESNPNIKVFKSSVIEKTDGQPGLLDITIKSNGSSETLRVGSIIMAAGWKPYDAAKLGHLGYGKPNVVTSIQMEDMAKKGKIIRPSDGKEAKKIAFIQCAGSRDPNHLPYCSSFCCATSLKQAKYVREKNSDAIAMIFYKDIRTPGQSELFYKNMQNDPGVLLTKADVTGVSDAGNGNLYVEAENALLGDKIKVEADLVVLAIGVVPNTRASQEYLDGLTEAQKKGDDAKAKYLAETPKPDFILNLTYRQGPEIPSLEGYYGFADSNFICFQYETRRTGIYAAGCVRQPMNMSEAQLDAAGAALKAIQCVEHVAQGIAVHPRAWDATFPDPNLQKCTACKRCTEECPFGAIEEDAKGIPFYKINRCRRCGTCMGACPERIVSFKDYSVDMIGSMLKSVEVPEEGFRFIALACENDAYPALDSAGINRKQLNSSVRIIPVRCLGSTNLVWVADAFSRGIDGLILLGCKYGENYQCHFIKGSELANYRFSKIQETLNKLQLEAERCQLVQVSISEYDKLPDIINDFVKKIEDIGPNPFKGF
ncbi:MAG: FAD-dependent oxidoreductase [Thermodesulfovibrionales bacterium]|nr:FAD-dependent oxidoreductase [Thermodesulfovibrionales bacterium]MDP3112192.1 FAD-dependent oxidoreductase [Thermodesulfovibrionales bacterium]